MSKRVANKVLLIGLDGIDWSVIQSPIQEGYMPTVEKLLQHGVYGNIALVQPTVAPMLWNTIVTGKRADKHGVCGYAELSPNHEIVRPVSVASCACKRIWNILTASGLKSNVVSWPASFPAEGIDGAVVSDFFEAQTRVDGSNDEPIEGAVYPLRLAPAIQNLLIRSSDINEEVLAPFLGETNFLENGFKASNSKLADPIASISSVHAAACHLIAQESCDFMAVYYEAAGELIRRCHETSHTSEAITKKNTTTNRRNVVKCCYEFLDILLKNLVELAGSNTTVVLIGANSLQHEVGGSQAQEQSVSLQRRSSLGMACISGPSVKQKQRLHGATILDVAPTILAMLGLPYGKDMDGRSWDEILKDEGATSKSIHSWESKGKQSRLDHEEESFDSIGNGISALPLMEQQALFPKIQGLTKNQVLMNHKINLATALSDSNRSEKAIDIWKQLLLEHPEVPNFAIQLASCYMRLGKLSECKSAIMGFNQEVQSCAVIQILLAEIAFEEGNTKQAVEMGLEIAEHFHKDYRILNRIGRLLLQINSWKDAETIFSKSLKLNAQNPTAYEGLAKAYLELDHLEQAIAAAQKATSLIYHFPNAHFISGEALHYAGREDEAIEAFETCLSMGYETEEVHGRLAGLYLLRDSSKAMRHRKLANLS